jgi:hypothetical protein
VHDPALWVLALIVCLLTYLRLTDIYNAARIEMSSGAIRLIRDMDFIGEGTRISEVFEAHDQRPCFMVSGPQFFLGPT